MPLLLALIAGVVGAVIGWIAAAGATVAVGSMLGVSNFEGGLGMLAVWGIGPLGGLAGLVVGIVLMLRRRGEHSLGGMAWRVPLVMAGIGALVAGGLWWMHETRPVLNSNGPAPRLAFEVRLPAGIAAPEDTRSITTQLFTDKNRALGYVAPNVTRDADGRTVLSGDVEVYYRAGWRLLEVKVPGQHDRLFKLNLPASPRRTTAFGPWERAAFLAAPGESEARKAGPDEGFEMRYRIVWQ